MSSQENTLLGSTTSMGHIRSSSVSLLAEVNPNSISNDEDDISKVQIYSDLCSYEQKLANLVNSVDKFKPDMNAARELIEVDRHLFQTLDSFEEYDKIDNSLKKLNAESIELDARTKEILGILNECHDELNALPMLKQVEFEMETINDRL